MEGLQLTLLELLQRTTERSWLGQAHFAVAANHVLLGDFWPALEEVIGGIPEAP